MAAITIDKTKVRVDEYTDWALTSIASVDIDAGEIIRLDGTTGKWVLANASETADLGEPFMAVDSVLAGRALSAVRKAVMFLGSALDSLDFAAPVYISDTDGGLDDAPGTLSVVAGIVIPVWGNGATPGKLLLLDLAKGMVAAAESAAGTAYTPTTSGDWTTPPNDVAEALDELAGRVEALEGA